jgi:hypothetical protein
MAMRMPDSAYWVHLDILNQGQSWITDLRRRRECTTRNEQAIGIHVRFEISGS